MNPVSLLAHQGGWDEILIIIGPLIVIVWVVGLVRRRIRRAADAESEDSGPGQGSARPQQPERSTADAGQN